MHKEKIQELTPEAFQTYGLFAVMINPNKAKIGEQPREFFRDMLMLNMGQQNLPFCSICRVAKRDLIVDSTEYHNYANEAILPLDGDILIHVGPATSSAEVPYYEIKIFHVPKGTMVTLNSGVWHGWPFAYQCEYVNSLIILPERAYVNDCHVVQLPNDKQIMIEEK